MKVNQKELAKVLSDVIKAVPAKATVPAFSCFKLELKNSKLTVVGTDTLFTIIKTIEVDADPNDEFTAVVNAQTLYSLISPLPKSEIEIELGAQLFIKHPAGKFSVANMEAEHYPKVGTLSHPIGKIQRDLLVTVQDGAQFYTSSSAEIGLDCAHLVFDSKTNTIDAYSTDKAKIVHKQIPFSCSKSFKACIPADVFLTMMSVLDNDEVDVFVTDKLVGFESGETKVFSLLSDAPVSEGAVAVTQKYLIADKKTTTITINNAELIKAVNISAVIAQDEDCYLRLNVKSDGLELYTKATSGESSITVPARVSGKELSTALNFKLLKSALQLVRSENAKLELNAQPAAIVVKNDDQEQDWLAIATPMRVR